MKIFNVHNVLAPLAIAALCASVLACGEAGRHGSASRSSSSSGIGPAQGSISGDYDRDDDFKKALNNDGDNDDSTQRKDRDNDSDNMSDSYYDIDDNTVRKYGHAADASDRRTVAALVKRYFAAAAREDGVTACSMIVPVFANSVPETLGQAAGPLYSRGNTCAVVLSKLFYHFHRQLAAHAAELEVTGVRVDGAKGIAVLGFRTLPGRLLHVAREGTVWKIDALLDLELP
jgi:hypothetical protein